jgi:osmotically-inducible protein OsmY
MTRKLLLLVCLASIALPACAGGGQAVRATPASSAPAGVMDDATITTRVKTVLLNDPQVAATKIDVSTAGGIVTLSGTVKSKADETRALELARQVTGVREVKSTLVVPTPQF